MPIALDETSTEVLPLAMLKDRLRITRSGEDADLLLTLNAAVGLVEGVVGPLIPRQVTETVSVNCGVAVLRQAPVVSVATVTDGSAAVTHHFDSSAGVLRALPTWGPVEVTYVAGRASVPDEITLAIIIIAQHLWELQRGSGPTQVPDDDFFPTPGLGYAIPSRAQDLLAPHALPPTVA